MCDRLRSSAAGGIIAIITLFGCAPFRIWPNGVDPRLDMDGPPPVEWITNDGDVVILRGNRWQTDGTVCPVHEVDPPVSGDRMIITCRHNNGGAGADWFS